VSDRVSQTVLLCEDDPQEQLVRAYLKKCDLPTEPPQFLAKNASRLVHGGNVDWVLQTFPGELEACRKRHVSHANTRLIAVVDADEFTVAQRRGHFVASDTDPTVILIPKRHIETWIRAALGQAVNEVDSYKKPEPKKAEIRTAANQIHGWARDNPNAGTTCVDSLRQALSHWRRIG
jgi:hypothetical protein